MSEQYGLPLLAQLPLAMRIRSDLDQGRPTVVSEPDGPIAGAYIEFARRTAAQLSRKPRNLKLDLPQIKIQNG